jgi:hypothetical protein
VGSFACRLRCDERAGGSTCAAWVCMRPRKARWIATCLLQERGRSRRSGSAKSSGGSHERQNEEGRLASTTSCGLTLRAVISDAGACILFDGELLGYSSVSGPCPVQGTHPRRHNTHPPPTRSMSTPPKTHNHTPRPYPTTHTRIAWPRTMQLLSSPCRTPGTVASTFNNRAQTSPLPRRPAGREGSAQQVLPVEVVVQEEPLVHLTAQSSQSVADTTKHQDVVTT